MGKLDFIDEEIKNLKEQGLYNIIRTIGSPVGAWTVVDGEKVLNMCSNNYLGFANPTPPAPRCRRSSGARSRRSPAGSRADTCRQTPGSFS